MIEKEVKKSPAGSTAITWLTKHTRWSMWPVTISWRFDGSGEPINLTFEAYFERFIYDADFARPHAIGYNEIIGAGNTINNIAEVYPNAVTIEYHFEGFDPTFAGLDWRSLRLVLEGKEGTWYLVGIVHDEWTI